MLGTTQNLRRLCTSSQSLYLSLGIACLRALQRSACLASVTSDSGSQGVYGMSTLQASAQKQLRQFVEQIERLEEEKKQLASDIRDKFLEAKATGFDVKALRKIISLRKKSDSEREEEESILEVYMHALGMLSDGERLQSAADAMIAAE